MRIQTDPKTCQSAGPVLDPFGSVPDIAQANGVPLRLQQSNEKITLREIVSSDKPTNYANATWFSPKFKAIMGLALSFPD